MLSRSQISDDCLRVRDGYESISEGYEAVRDGCEADICSEESVMVSRQSVTAPNQSGRIKDWWIGALNRAVYDATQHGYKSNLKASSGASGFSYS